MQLILDGEAQQGELTAQEAAEKVETYIKERADADRVLTRCLLDGAIVESPDPIAAIRAEAGTLERIEITTQSRESLVRQTGETAADYIDNLFPAIEKVAARLATGEQPTPNDWEQILTGLQWLIAACEGIRQNADTLPENTIDLSTPLQAIHDSLEAMAAALEAGDTVSLADQMEYELLDPLRTLQTQLKIFRSQ